MLDFRRHIVRRFPLLTADFTDSVTVCLPEISHAKVCAKNTQVRYIGNSRTWAIQRQ